MSVFCYGCMNKIDEEAAVCPICGFDKASVQNLPFLPLGSALQKERYTVGKKLSSNNESTKYIAFDYKTEKTVIIREFLPNGLCARKKGSNKIILNSEKAESYKKLLL